MRFGILGALEVDGDGDRRIGRPADQRVLAMLLLNAGRLVPVSRLVDALWDEDPPATAAKQVRNAVSRLREALACDGTSSWLRTDQGGYRLTVPVGALDASLFGERVARATVAAAAGQVAEAAALLSSALGLWRGSALAGQRGRMIEAAAIALNERRYAAAEQYCEHMLTLGRHLEILPQLSDLVAEHPLRERAAARLMLALCRSGRQAEALQTYQRIRTALAEELGLDPGEELWRLHQQILTGAACPVPAMSQRSRAGLTDHAADELMPGSIHLTRRWAHGSPSVRLALGRVAYGRNVHVFS